MNRRKQKLRAAAPASRARPAHNRQRQRLIEACISALHIHGPSRTTVEKVVAIAKMSPGIVRFYFDSKAAMLVASLKFLAAEFEERVLVPVSKLKATPVAALELLVDLYLDPDIASPRKVSVWYAFWGEASSRQEYYDICGQKDESFAALVHELIGRLIEDTGQPHLDSGGIALGLIGALEMLWQDFAFQAEGKIDRKAAKARCMAYLKSVFPDQFSPRAAPAGPESGSGAGTRERLAGWVYGDARALARERAALFADVWQLVGHDSQIPRAGDFFALDTVLDRVLLVRDGFGGIHALRNSCPESPHALVTSRRGRFVESFIECKIHQLRFALDGRRIASGPLDADVADAALTAFPVERVHGLLLVQSRRSTHAASSLGGWLAARLPEDLTVLHAGRETPVAADWKILVEQWLGRVPRSASDGVQAGALEWSTRPWERPDWTARHYRNLAGTAGGGLGLNLYLAPHQWLESRPDGLTVMQVMPTAPGHCVLREMGFTRCKAERGARALAYLAARARATGQSRSLAESTQRGILDFGYRAGRASTPSPALAWFRRHLIERVPALGFDRPPTDD